MRQAIFTLMILGLFSCMKSDNDQLEQEQEPVEEPSCINIVTDAYGRKYPSLEPPTSQYCGPGWGRKMCRFLNRYDGTKWVDAGNGQTSLPDVSFSNFSGTPYFVSFFTLDSNASMCRGWKLGESQAADGSKYTVDIRGDEDEEFSFVYRYYGFDNVLKNTIVYRYEIIDGLLNFSSSDGQETTFYPSDRNYSVDSLNTEEIIKREGCFF